MKPENRRDISRLERAHYKQDPLEESGATLDQIAFRIEQADKILENDPSLTIEDKASIYRLGSDLRMDWLYNNPDISFNDLQTAYKSYDSYFKEARGFMKGNIDTLNPADYWDVSFKQLDLRALLAHRAARDAETTFRDTSDNRQQQLRSLSEHIMKNGVLIPATNLAKEIGQYANGDGYTARKARGTMYELLLLNYARYKSYERQTLDTDFARSALDREDRPRIDAWPKRSFDISILAEGTLRLIQAKNNNDNTDEYEYPIEKVSTRKFRFIMKNLPQLVHDFRLLVTNPGDPALRNAIDKASTRLHESLSVDSQRVEGNYAPSR